MANKAFLEITNVCNLSCSFCHGTKRPPKFITREEFERASGELRTFAEYLYFHLMGEPLLHPMISEFLELSESLGFKVILTTNGTLLRKKADALLSAPALYKVSISLHAFEANVMNMTMEEYLQDCFEFCEKAAQAGKIAVMRLWNAGGLESRNAEILEQMKGYFGSEWREIYSGYKIADKIFLEWGEKFDWPDVDAETCSVSHSCYGLRDQVGVLSDGTVVPCCLDAEGAVNLGNILDKTLAEILESSRAKALKRSFETKKITEPLCQRCGYAKTKRFK